MNNCLACGNPDLKLCLDLGDQPLANNYEQSDKYPLQLVCCDNCYHAQLSLSIDPEELYRDYAYVSGTSDTLQLWFDEFAEKLTKELKPQSVLDVASNDGSLLLAFKSRGWQTLGVDPAKNLDTQGIVTIHDFFDEDWRFEDTQFDVITAFNVLAHGPHPLSLLTGIYNNLKDDGVAYVMTSQGGMFDSGQFDTIYHEHHSYFSLNSFQELANRAGFTDISYTVEPIHGGSFLFRLTKDKSTAQLPQNRPDFEGFAAKAATIKPYKLIGFGAAAKAVVVINHLNQQLAYIVDEAPLKIGKLLPGTTIPVQDLAYMAEDDDNLVIIVYAWNFYDEIMAKVQAVRPDRADVFIRYWQ